MNRLRMQPLRFSDFLFLIVILNLLLGAGCKQIFQSDELVTAGGKPFIHREDFRTRLNELAPECIEKTDIECLEIKKHLLDEMIEEEILFRQAQAGGVTVSPKDVEDAALALKETDGEMVDSGLKADTIDEKLKARLEKQLTVRRFMDTLLACVDLADEEVREYYPAHREIFVRPMEVRVRQIVVSDADQAAEILDLLKKGEDFIQLAEERSKSPEASLGGDLGFLSPGQMPPEIEDVVFSLPEGTVKEISSAFGIHIIRVEEHRQPRELEFLEIESTIRERLLREKTKSFYEKWLKDQIESAQLKILDPDLAALPGYGEAHS